MPAGFHNPEPWYKIGGLEAAGHEVLFVDQIGVTNPRPRNASKVARYALGALRGGRAATPRQSSTEQVRVLVVPPRHHRVTDRLNDALVRRRVRGRAESLGFDRPILWFRFPSPEFVRLIGHLGESLVVYECVDRFEAFGYPRAATRALRAAEHELFRRADLTVVTSEGLREHAARHSPNVVLHRHGVDLERFGAEQRTPGEIAGLARPVIGYTGPIDSRIDPELIAAVAGDNPAGSVVIIGPVSDRAAEERLQRVPNCHLLGARPHADMPSFVRSLDVGILPYRSGDATRDISPVKSLEYLAAGVPVVATAVAELARFGSVIDIAPSTGKFVEAVRVAAAGGSAGDRVSRAAEVEAFGWPAVIDGLLRVVHGTADDVAAAARRTGTSAE